MNLTMESTETITPEVVAPETKEMLAVVRENALTPERTQSLQSSFAPFFKKARGIIEQSQGIVVTNISQTLEIRLARECRLALRAVRVASDKLRKELKEESLRTGRAIDGFHAILLHLTEAEEKRLDDQEKFVEKAEAARKAELKTARELALAPYGVDTSFMSLGEMPDATFAQLLENTRAGHEAKLAAAQKAERDRIEAENARLKEEARIREENARLAREAKEREEAARIEREKAAAEKAALEAEAKAEREAAAKAKADAEAREKAAQQAAAAALKAEQDRLNAITAAERAKAAKAAEEAAAKAKAEREAVEAKAAAEQRRLMAERESELERLAREQKKIDEARRQEREAYEATQRRALEELKAKAAQERRDAELKAMAAKAEADKLEAQIRAEKAAAAKRLAAEELARKKAEAAPDREKLMAYSQALSLLRVPDVVSDDAKIVVQEIVKRRSALVVFIAEQVATL